MNRRRLLAVLGCAALPRAVPAVAQQPAGVPRIGVLMGSSPSVEAEALATFRDALAKLGYIDGQTVVIEVRYAESRPERFGSLARELVAMSPAVIACVGRQETAALQAVTRTIPIVFMQVHNPVEQGLVVSLARPGGNTTGFTQMSAELDPKRLELLHEIAPSVSRAAFLINPNNISNLRFSEAEAAAKSLGIALRRVDAATPAELTAALAAIENSSSQALLVHNDPMLTGTEQSRIVDFAVARRLPTVFEGIAFARLGLFGYGPDLSENRRLAAGYVVKILKGA
jgi:putative tryptophan/tyrosine transport system substrate-binding protein